MKTDKKIAAENSRMKRLGHVTKKVMTTMAADTVAGESPKSMQKKARDVAEIICDCSDLVLKAAEKIDGKQVIFKDPHNKTRVTFIYDNISESFEFLNSGGQGALIWGRLDFKGQKENYDHAYTTLRTYEEINREMHKDKNIAVSGMDIYHKGYKQRSAKQELAGKDRKTIEDYVNSKIGHLFPKNKCLIKIYVADSDIALQLAKREKVMPGILHKNLAYMFLQEKLDVNGKKSSGPAEDELYYAVMEYVPKCSKLNFKQKFDVIEQVLSCIEEALFPVGIVHRDIKPDNILPFRLSDVSWPKELIEQYKDSDGKRYTIGAKLADTGLLKTIMKETQTEQTMPGLFLGTPEFAAPEIAVAKATEDVTFQFSWHNDLYSTGATIYYYLTGFPSNQPREPTESESLFNNLSNNLYKTLRPSETKDLHADLAREYSGDEKRIKKAGYMIDLVIAGMMQRDKKQRYCRISDCVKDLCAVKNGREPVNIMKLVKQFGMKEEDYIKSVFTHVQQNMPNNAYYDKEGAERRQNGSWLGRLFGF